MQIKTGVDIVDDKRILKNTDNKSFIKRVFHASEMDYAKKNSKIKQDLAKKLAGIFALKEAVSKAFNLSIPIRLDIEINHT